MTNPKDPTSEDSELREQLRALPRTDRLSPLYPIDAYEDDLVQLIKSREEQIKMNKWHESLENLAGRGYITFEQKDSLWDRDCPPFAVELSQKGSPHD